MLSPFGKAVAYYLYGGFGLGLLCLPVLMRPVGVEQLRWASRTRRRSLVFAILGPLHPVLAAVSLGLAAEAGHQAEDGSSTTDRGLRSVAWGSIGVSLVVAAVVCAVARR